jgi:hypothetical protein
VIDGADAAAVADGKKRALFGSGPAARGAPDLVARAERSLAIAGGALDPSAPGGPDLPLAALLLTHTLAMAAGAIDGGDAHRAPAKCVAALEQSRVLARAAGSIVRGRAVLACLDPQVDAGLVRAELVDAEQLLGRVVRVLRGQPAIARAASLRRWGFALLVASAVTAALVPAFRSNAPWTKYRWTASTAAFGFATTGLLGVHGPMDLVFHTNFEERPSLTIDLLALRSIHAVGITNRSDCCDSRCIPLFVEVAGEDGRFVEVARREKAFDVWNVTFPSQKARYVRLHVGTPTFFHLKEIQIL